ncbi:cullin-4A [Trichonephila clavipes]|nr:cullin-4A [Trichonephila clavipes]
MRRSRCRRKRTESMPAPADFYLFPQLKMDMKGHRFVDSDEWLATLTAESQGLGLNPGEDIDVCKCIGASRHEGTLNNRRAARLLVRLVERMRGGRPLTLPQGVLPQNWGGTELNCTVTCMVLKATANDRRTSSTLP